MKIIKFSPSKKVVNSRESFNLGNKSALHNDFLKNAKCVLKNNKSINHILKKVEARSNNISPINSSFTGNRKVIKKHETKSNFFPKQELLETEKDGIVIIKVVFYRPLKTTSIHNEFDPVIVAANKSFKPAKIAINVPKNDNDELNESSRNKLNVIFY
jgi:hypothetical protein